jgi:hypothetical protein
VRSSTFLSNILDLAYDYAARSDWPNAVRDYHEYLNFEGQIPDEDAPSDWVLAHCGWPVHWRAWVMPINLSSVTKSFCAYGPKRIKISRPFARLGRSLKA